MEFMFQTTATFCFLLLVNGQIPTEDFLFGTTNGNVLWFQHGTTDWTLNNQAPTTTGLNFTQSSLGVHGTAYFHSRQFLVFSDTGAKSIFISNTNTSQHAFVYVGTSASVGHLAVDWLSGNVYWCDGAFGWIGMLALPNRFTGASLQNKFKVVIDKYVDMPSGIAVQPSHEWIFWTDIGKQPKIERATLDGSNRNVLVLHGLLKPISLTIDTKENNIYWTDPIRRTIESCDFYGNYRRVIRTDVGNKYYGIEIFRDCVLVSEQLKKQILIFSVTDGRTKSDPYTPGGLDVASIALYTAENQYINNDACTTMGCGHICLVTSSGATCTCQDGYKLHTDGKQCTSSESKGLERSLLFTNQSKICALPITYINIFNYYPMDSDCKVGGATTGTITHLDINVANDEMYFSIDATIYRQKLNQNATSLYSATNQITGLTFDWITNELYWTIFQSNTIYKASIPSNENDQITSPTAAVTSLSKPSYISINPLESVLFAITGDSTKKIERISINNSTNTVLESTRLTSPKWLTYNRPKDRLYWTDTGKVGSMTSSGQDIKIQDVSGISPLHGIAVYKDYVLWLQSSSDKSLMHVDEKSTENQHTVPLNNFLSPGAFVIYDKDIQPQRNVPCVKDNGGCQQICVVHGYFPKCECYLGYKLLEDSKSCTIETISTSYFLTIDELSERIYKVFNSTQIGAIDTGLITPLSVAFDYNRNVIVWIDEKGNSIKSINDDGKAETTLTTEVTPLTSLDIDQSTSNIYYTTQDSIKVFSVEDSAKRTLISSLVQPNKIKLHSKLGKMVWIEHNNGEPTIRQAFMDGSDIGVVVQYSASEIFIKSPSDLAIDTEEYRVIWSDNELDSIMSVSLGNTAHSKFLLSNTGERPIAVDVVGEYVYYIGKGQRSVKRIRKEDGTNSQVVFSSILFGRLISLGKVTTTRISRHELCTDKNGQCSRLCLPRGSNQRVCQCRDGVQIKDDGKTCVGDIQCPDMHGAAVINDQCSRYQGVSCDYTCSNGYSKSSSVNTVTCLPNGEWNVSSNILCTRILCPANFTNGQVSSGCTRYVGSTCGVSCNEGYVGDISTIICHDNGQWNVDMTKTCKLDYVDVPADKAADPLSTGAIIGLAAGGVVLVVILIAVILVCHIQRVQERKKRMHQGIQMLDYPNGMQNNYSPTQRDDSVDDETYDVIAGDEKFIENMKVAQVLGESNSSHTSLRYSKWPEDPPPDYHYAVGADGGYNSYLWMTKQHNSYLEMSAPRTSSMKKEDPASRHDNDNPYLSPCSDSPNQDDYNGYLVAIGGGDRTEFNHHM